MTRRSRPVLIALGAAWLAMIHGPAQAQSATTVLGGGMAQACSEAAQAQVRAADARRARGRPVVISSAEGLIACDRALATEALQMRDLAATYVNRGVLLMGRASYPAALADYDYAVRLRPRMGEAHANRGAALIALGRYQEGVTEITLGLELGTEQPEKSYYNRGVARERLDDLKGAYLDYLKASELKPDWEDPRLQMARFTLTPK